MRRIKEVRELGLLRYLRPDAKAAVTVELDDQQRAFRVETIVLSTQHDEGIDLDLLRQDIKEHVINPVIPENLLDDNTNYLINPSGRFVLGGPQADSGLTGRKIIVDTYGGAAHHGGGAFSGKDATKVDRSAAYMARYIAKNLVAAGVADKLEVQLAYAIGVAQPISVAVDAFGTAQLPEAQIVRIIRELFDLRPAAIIDRLDLRRPIYGPTAAFGHFGRSDVELPWEQLDAVAAIKEVL
jgi:S-adenosylmethionine synthetase